MTKLRTLGQLSHRSVATIIDEKDDLDRYLHCFECYTENAK